MQGAETVFINIDGREIKVERLPDGTFKKPDYLKEASREVVGIKRAGCGNRNGKTDDEEGIFQNSLPEELKQVPITAPATPLAAKFSGWKSRLKPSFEPIVLAQKPIEKSYAHNAEVWGVAGLWIDGGRVGSDGATMAEHTKNNSVSTYGNGLNGGRKIKIAKGRYPANVIRSGEPLTEAEFAKAGPKPGPWGKGQSASKSLSWCQSNEFRFIDNGKYQEESDSTSRYFQKCPPDPNCLTCTDCITSEDAPPHFTGHPEAARFKYCPKAGKKERGEYNNHPTVKSLELVKYLCRLTKTPDGGVVLDPFAGSGTTALAALSEGRDFILIEKEPEYVAIARRRIAEYTGAEIAPKEIETKQGETVKQMSLW